MPQPQADGYNGLTFEILSQVMTDPIKIGHHLGGKPKQECYDELSV